MRKFICLSIALSAFIGHQKVAADTMAPASSNTITEAKENRLPVALRWRKACADRVAAFKGKPCDIIFVGDSITQGFDTALWKEHYEKRNALNFGVGADGIQSALWRLDNMDIRDLRPKVVVVMLGMNNAPNTPEDIATGIQAVNKRIRNLYPQARIVVMSVTANKRMPDKTPKINALLEKLADNKTIFYCDIFSRMTPTDSSFKGLGRDGVHLVKEGYEIWTSTLDPLLKELLGEK